MDYKPQTLPAIAKALSHASLLVASLQSCELPTSSGFTEVVGGAVSADFRSVFYQERSANRIEELPFRDVGDSLYPNYERLRRPLFALCSKASESS